MYRYLPLLESVFSLLLAAFAVASDPPTTFRVEETSNGLRVVLGSGEHFLIGSPHEGLWSIATAWNNDRPDGWLHAKPNRVEASGEWTILHGELETPEGKWLLRDAYRPRGRAVECIRRFTWTGEKPATGITLSTRWVAQTENAREVLPGILYHGNPSGAKSGRTPVFESKPDETALYEEHRFPVPMAAIEWDAENGIFGAAIESLPSPVPCGNLPDQWWSMGLRRIGEATELLLLSGPCASNGRHNVIKAIQPGFKPYGQATLNVPPGTVIEKTFYLEAYSVAEEGSGFQRPLWTTIDRFHPYDASAFPTMGEIVLAKVRFAKTRWLEKSGAAGFRKYPDRDILVFGWCGQTASPGYAFQVLAQKLDDPELLDMAKKSLDFLSDPGFYEGGFHTWYDVDQKAWHGDEPLSQGQAMMNFARAIRAGRKAGRDTARWEAFLRKACDFHAKRILSDGWCPKSTDEGFFIGPLCLAAELFDHPIYRNAGLKAADHYAARHVSMREPYWGGTLDASCEDKEGAFAALQGFLGAYELTRNEEYLKYAGHAGDVALTYTVVWDIDLPPGRLRNHAFKTRGWTAVSVQNQHIDVYGVLIAPDIYRLALYTQSERLKRLAHVMYRSCGQLLDPYGSQGEQPQHTNYAQRGDCSDVFALRGGYVEDWTVFWITAHFLHAAAQFEEMGAE